MKITVAWEAGEEKKAAEELEGLKARYPKARVKYTEKFPFYHAYVTEPRPKH